MISRLNQAFLNLVSPVKLRAVGHRRGAVPASGVPALTWARVRGGERQAGVIGCLERENASCEVQFTGYLGHNRQRG